MMCILSMAMQDLLRLLLFSVFFTTGTSLKCETCFSFGESCTGPLQKCDVGQDTCSVLLNEITVGEIKTPVSVKGCADSKACNDGPVSLVFGQGVFVRSNAVCCKGDACRSIIPQLPSVNRKPNGLQCPGCFSVTNTCPEEMVPCTGAEDTCFYTVQQRHDGPIATQTIMKGCTTETICSRFKTGTILVGGYDITYTRVECRQAKWALP